MLVLSRREGERITIGGRITITVVRVEAQGVRIGIDAPADIPILRNELLISGDSIPVRFGTGRAPDQVT